MTSVTLRTGGTVTYTYGNFQDAYGNVNQWVESQTSGGGTWSYTPQVISTCAQGTVGCQQSVIVAQPSGDNEACTFTLDNGAWNVQTQLYTGTTALLQTVTTDYDFSNACPLACDGDSYIRPIRVTTTDVVPGGPKSAKDIGRSINYATSARAFS